MSGRGKGVRTRRNRVTPYANSAISDRQWDLNNPSNWTSQKFREELDKKGIKTPSSLPKSVLKQLYIENSNTSGITTSQIQQNRTISDNDTSNPLSTEPEVAVTDSGTNVQPLASLDINNIPVPNTSLAEQDTMSVNHQVTSSNTGGITNDIPMQNSNFNSMATMSTMLAHCFSGFQQSLNHFNQNLNKGTNTDSSGFNLQQWYKAQSSPTNHMDQVPNIPIFQTGLQQHLIYPSPTVQQLDARDSSTQHGFQGVRSDSFSNVDIISPILQKQIIEDGPFPQAGSKCSTSTSSVPTQFRSNVVLNKIVHQLWDIAIASKTRSAYETGFKHFERFMLLNNFKFNYLPPISEDILIYFTAYCFHFLKLQYSTIKLYLCGIRYKYLKNNCKDPLESDYNTPLDRLSYILNSVKKLQKPNNKKRLPITFDILEKIIFRLRQGVFTPFIDLMLEAVCTVGFYGFMRCGEFTVLKANQFDPSVNLCIGDIILHKDIIILKLKQSKTDPFRKGVDIQLHKVKNQICPFKILVKYLQVRESLKQGLPSDPLFISQNALALERNYFINCIKQVLSICGFNPDH
ncbi:uncharacterized protein LOC134709631 [Mytilus trossulus]|uniref:uncharacterized protein LOC134709631 n=1 Tax=Mytilus trossulus TaxID=6551 RepID=UPI003007B8FF